MSRNSKKKFYGTSPYGTGKTVGAIIAVFNELSKKPTGTRYLIVCSTFDMAYATLQVAENFQENFRQKFLIRFVSKVSISHVEYSQNDAKITIATPNEILSLINAGCEGFTHIIFDDACAYMSWKKYKRSSSKNYQELFG